MTRRGSVAARAAGVAFLPLPLVPFIYGLAAVLDDTAPDPRCFEYCDVGRDVAGLPLVLGGVGIWMALLIWRRHVAAMALALFLTVLLTGLWAIGFIALVTADGSVVRVNPWLSVVGLALLAVDGLLGAALREEMVRAGRAAGAKISAPR